MGSRSKHLQNSAHPTSKRLLPEENCPLNRTSNHSVSSCQIMRKPCPSLGRSRAVLSPTFQIGVVLKRLHLQSMRTALTTRSTSLRMRSQRHIQAVHHVSKTETIARNVIASYIAAIAAVKFSTLEPEGGGFLARQCYSIASHNFQCTFRNNRLGGKPGKYSDLQFHNPRNNASEYTGF